MIGTVRTTAERRDRQAFFRRVAPHREHFVARWVEYYGDLRRLFTFLVRPDASVIEVGCGTGALMRTFPNPLRTGMDVVPEMIAQARAADPSGRYIVDDIEALEHAAPYDVVLMFDLVNSLVDVQQAFANVRSKLCHDRTRVIVTFHNFLWKSVLALAERLGLKSPVPMQNWLTVGDVETLLALTDFEVVRRGQRFLCPVGIPVLSWLCNRVLVHFPPFSWFALYHYVVARPVGFPRHESSVSIIVPVRNEAGNIARVIRETPVVGNRTELIFVEGHSQDETWRVVQEACAEYRGPLTLRCMQQAGKGKGDAVRMGFSVAQNEILMILDGDLGVEPTELPKFYEAIASGKGEFINGSRLVYPREQYAMRFLNLVGNKLFSVIFAWLLQQRIKDTLCGTKVLRARDYARIAADRAYFGSIDPFGDFDLLLGAAKQSLRLIEVPIRYRERTYGSTNISRMRHGLLLFLMTARAAVKLRFV